MAVAGVVTPAEAVGTADRQPAPDPTGAAAVSAERQHLGPGEHQRLHHGRLVGVGVDTTSGFWTDSDGSNFGDGGYLSDFFFDSGSAYGAWVAYTATGPGGTTTERFNVSVSPDPRVDYVRDNGECRSVAEGG